MKFPKWVEIRAVRSSRKMSQQAPFIKEKQEIAPIHLEITKPKKKKKSLPHLLWEIIIDQS